MNSIEKRALSQELYNTIKQVGSSGVATKIKKLVGVGADVNFKPHKTDYSNLEIAINYTNKELCYWLLDNEYIVSKQEALQVILKLVPLGWMPEIDKIIDISGVDINQVDKEGNNILHLAIRSKSQHINIKNFIDLLAKNNFNFNVLNRAGNSCLIEALLCKSLTSSGKEVLCESLANLTNDVLNTKNKLNKVAFSIASESFNLTIMKILIAVGADVNILASFNDASPDKLQPAMAYVIKSGNLAVADYLLSVSSFNPTVADMYGRIPSEIMISILQRFENGSPSSRPEFAFRDSLLSYTEKYIIDLELKKAANTESNQDKLLKKVKKI